MGEKYTTESIVGFNNSPPVDDGTVSEANKVKWATTKDKLADPIKDQVANIDAKLVTMADIGPDAKTANYTTLTGDHEKTIEVTAASVTITLLAVASAPSGYTVTIKNNSGSTVDVTATGTETIDSSTATITLADNETSIVQLKQGGAGYISLQQVTLTGGAGLTSVNSFTKTQKWAKGVDIASANDTVLLTDGNYNDVTGTTTTNGMTDGTAGEIRKFHYDGAVLLKHDTAPTAGFSKLWMPNSADYTTAANDEFEFTYDGTYWRATNYVLASGKAIAETVSGAATGASLFKLFTNTHSGDATSEFLDAFTATYDEYWIRFLNVAPATDIVTMSFQLGTSGTYITSSSYSYAGQRINSGAGTASNTSGAATAVLLTGDSVGNATNENMSGWLKVHNPFAAAHTYMDKVVSYKNDGGLLTEDHGSSACSTTASKTDIKFTFSSGNIASGEITVYGVKV